MPFHDMFDNGEAEPEGRELVVLAGTAQGPMNIQESCAAASAAAAKVAVLRNAS